MSSVYTVAAPAQAPVANLLPPQVEFALAREIMTRHYQRTGQLLDITALLDSVSGSGPIQAPTQPQTQEIYFQAGQPTTGAAGPVSSRSVSHFAPGGGYPTAASGAVEGQNFYVNSIPHAAQPQPAATGYQFPFPTMLPWMAAAAPDESTSRRRSVAGTGYDYRSSVYYSVAERILAEATAGRTDLPGVLVADCTVALALIIAWCHLPLFKKIWQGQVMTLGADRIREELRMRADRLRVEPGQANQAKSVFYVLQSLGLIQVVGVRGCRPGRGLDVPGDISMVEFDQLKLEASKLRPEEGGRYLHKRCFQSQAFFYRLKDRVLAALESDDAGHPLPDFNPFLPQSHVGSPVEVRPYITSDHYRVAPGSPLTSDSFNQSRTSEGYESHLGRPSRPTQDAIKEVDRTMIVPGTGDPRLRSINSLSSNRVSRSPLGGAPMRNKANKPLVNQGQTQPLKAASSQPTSNKSSFEQKLDQLKQVRPQSYETYTMLVTALNDLPDLAFPGLYPAVAYKLALVVEPDRAKAEIARLREEYMSGARSGNLAGLLKWRLENPGWSAAQPGAAEELAQEEAAQRRRQEYTNGSGQQARRSRPGPAIMANRGSYRPVMGHSVAGW